MLRVSSLGSGIRKNSDKFEVACHRNSCEFRYKTVLARIIHQPQGASPRFLHLVHEPHASAFRLICTVFWAR